MFDKLCNKLDKIEKDLTTTRSDLATLKRKSDTEEFLIKTSDLFKKLTEEFIKKLKIDYKQFTNELKFEKMAIFQMLYPEKNFYKDFDHQFYNDNIFTTELSNKEFHKEYLSFLSKKNINNKNFFFIQECIMKRNQLCHNSVNHNNSAILNDDLNGQRLYFEEANIDLESKNVFKKVIDALILISENKRSRSSQKRIVRSRSSRSRSGQKRSGRSHSGRSHSGQKRSSRNHYNNKN